MASGVERAVETNQRHLIKKILARYPSQWTFFRELVQNADDACAKNVTIEFETEAQKEGPRLVKRTIVSNDGLLFSSEDWNRLTSIASGNPAVDKIGFFGVGFYCVFSLSDNPCVSSGKTRLEFFWKGNSLYTRETTQEQNDAWTRFFLPVPDVNDSTPPPEFEEIGGFLAELLCFTRHIRSVKVSCDGVLQVSASREDEFAIPLQFPAGLTHEGDDSLIGMINRSLSKTAPVSFLAKKNMASVSRTKLVMTRHHTAPRAAEESSISFIRAQGTFHTQLSEFSARAYQDMTQKSHPPTIQLSILSTLDRQYKSSRKKPEMFLHNKLSPMGCKGRVFIGFVTSQTIGSVHVGGPFVPTMERENLDFATPIAKEWNMSLFYSTGTLARALHEMICTNPSTFYITPKSEPLPYVPSSQPQKDNANESSSGGGGFLFNAMRKATSIFTAFASDNPILSSVDEEKEDDDALFASLEENTGAIVVTSMANFAPMFSECRPYTGVGPRVWQGFIAKEFDDGPKVWTSQGRAISSDKARIFPSSDADLPQLSSIETFAVVPIQLSRSRPVGYRNVGGLASTLIEKLKEDKQICAFDLSDILSELQKRPLRGIQETMAFVEWFFRPNPVQFVNVRCGNCGAHTKIRSTITDFSCPSCRYHLSYKPPQPSSSAFRGDLAATGSRESQLRKALLDSTKCLMEDGKEYQISKWRYKLDPKLEVHLAMIMQTLPLSVTEQICPLAITKRSSVELQLEELTFERWFELFYSGYSTRHAAQPVEMIDHSWRLLHLAWKQFWSTHHQNFLATFIKTTPCIPTKTANGALAVPKSVYTSELEDNHEDISVLASFPSWFPQDDLKKFLKFLVQELGVRESVAPLVIVKSFLQGKTQRQDLWHFLQDKITENNRDCLDPELVRLLATSKCLARMKLDKVTGKFTASLESYLPNQMFSPSPELLELDDDDVPVVCLETSPEQKQAVLAYLENRLSLRKSPQPDVFLKIASSDRRPKVIRINALALYVSGILQHNPAFDFSQMQAAVVPCKVLSNASNTEDLHWASPKDCFLEIPSFLRPVVGLKMCCLENPVLVKQLGIRNFPPPKLAIDFLQQRISTNSLNESLVFEVLDQLATKQTNEMSESDGCARLSEMPIVSVPSSCILRQTMAFAQPRTCYFESVEDSSSNNNCDQSELKLLFCFVRKEQWSKTPKHRGFYQSIGVREAPTLSELAEQLASNPQEALSRLGHDNYLNLLRSIASDFNKIKPTVKQLMSKSPCLLGRTIHVKPIAGGDASALSATAELTTIKEDTWSTFVPGDIVIEDDSRYRRLFEQVPSCPCELSLEQMYLRLGSLPISQVVTETFQVRTEVAEYTNEAALMDRRLCERISVLVQRIPIAELNQNQVKLWMDLASKRRRENAFGSSQGALVMQVPEVKCELRLTMRKGSLVKISTPTSCVYKGKLYMTRHIDFFHIASGLASEFCSTKNKDRALLWATLLQSPTQSLEEMGFVLPPEPVVIQPRKRLLEEEAPVHVKHAPVPALPAAGSMALEKPRQVQERSTSRSTSSDGSEPMDLKDLKLPTSTAATKPPPITPQLPPPVGANVGSGNPMMDLKDLKLPTPVIKPSPSIEDPVPPNDGLMKRPPQPMTTAKPPPAAGDIAGAVSSMLPSIFGNIGQNLTGNANGKQQRVKMDPNRFRDDAISSAIDKCRPSDAPAGRITSPATQTPYTEPMLDCTEPHDLMKDSGIGSIECFVQQGSTTLQPFQTHSNKAREFSNLLVQMSMEIFGLDCSVIHLYWDERGTSRAFNRGGSLFFNLNCWVNDNDSMKNSQTWKRWFGTFCHELSHNLHSQHDASFANFLELFCVEFSDKFLNSLRVRGL